MLVFGITGGSGTGKTTVSDIFRSLGVYVADADKIAHTVTAGADCLNEITKRFGDGVKNTDGTLNRKKLGEIVFSDSAELRALNGITHKYIKAEIEKQLHECGKSVAAIDGAVIIGSEVEDMCRFIVSVTAPYEERIRRIMSRDGISEEDAKKRLSAQPTDGFYIDRSRYIIYNNGDKKALKTQAEDIFNKIKDLDL